MRAWGSGFFFRCICRFESDSNLRTWVNSLSKEVTTSDEPPTHTGCSVLSEWISEGGIISWEYSETWATHRSFLKCCTCFNSSEKWWKSPCCSQPVSDNQKPLPSMCCPKGLPAAVLQLCTKLARVLLQGGELGFQCLQLSEFPHLLWG